MVNKEKLDRGYGAVHAPLAPGRHRYFRFYFRFYFRSSSLFFCSETSMSKKFKLLTDVASTFRPPTNLNIDQAFACYVQRRKTKRE